MRPRKPHPYLTIILSFAGVIAVGTLLLLLPVSSASAKPVKPLTALFSATSAVCVTGLSVIDISAELSGFGQTVMALLMEIGGLSIITVAVFVFTVIGGRIGIYERFLLRESLGQDSAGTVTKLVMKIVSIALVIQSAGLILNFGAFLLTYPGEPLKALKFAAFHTVSAYNNAGFDIFGSDSMQSMRDNIPVNLSTAFMIISGGIGFPVISELISKRKNKYITLNTKLCLISTAVLIITGTLAIKLLGGFGWLESFFTSVTSRTAGFSTLDLSVLSEKPAVYAVVIGLMVTGACPCSTGGGIKTTTIAVILLAVCFYAVNRKTHAFGRNIPESVIFKAFVLLTVAVMIISTGTLVLSAIQPELGLDRILFEVVSAFSTTGLSMGITSSLSSASRIVIIILMFIGRLGPLTVISMVNRNWMTAGDDPVTYPDGNILVG